MGQPSTERMGRLSAVVSTGWVPPKSKYLYHFLHGLTQWTSVRSVDPKQHVATIVPVSIPREDVFWTNWGNQENALLTPEGIIWSARRLDSPYQLPDVPSQHPVRYLGGLNGHPLLARADETWFFASGSWHKMSPPRGTDLYVLNQELQVRYLVHMAFCDAASNPSRTRILNGTRWVEPPRHTLSLRAFPTFVDMPPHVKTIPANLILPTMDAWIEGDPHHEEQFFDVNGQRHTETPAIAAINTVHSVELSLKRLIKSTGGKPDKVHKLDVLFRQLTPHIRTLLELGFVKQSFTVKEIISHGGPAPRLEDLLGFWGSKSGGLPTKTDMYTFLRYQATSIPTMLFLGAVETAVATMESRSGDVWPTERDLEAEIGWIAR